MNLDPRIKSLTDILTCTNVEEAHKLIGYKGYFADHIGAFEDLSRRASVKDLDTLARVDEGDLPFVEGNIHWRYFLPECRLKPEKKEYKPFDSTTFEQQYGTGSVIIYRNKEATHRVYKAIIVSTTRDYMENEFYVVIGKATYTLDELFRDYEICEFGEWKPFGVAEE